jgi:KTSC domain-containing protein
MIERKPVESSNIKSVGFCPDKKCIEVCFNNGSVYSYPDCDQKLYDDLMASESKGKFVNAHLKNRKFTKIS